jgi:hypothetical protein
MQNPLIMAEERPQNGISAHSGAIREKTARFRAVRLAKEAGDKHELAPHKSSSFGDD